MTALMFGDPLFWIVVACGIAAFYLFVFAICREAKREDELAHQAFQRRNIDEIGDDVDRELDFDFIRRERLP